MARKMGTNGAEVFHRVADSIARQTADGTYTIDWEGRACFTHEALTVRCSNTPESIARVIAKYRRGLPRGGRSAQPRR
jgi:hypothetical protein